MKRILLIHFLIFLLNSHGNTQGSQAEDLWGNKIDFSGITGSNKTVIIQPFSPANCGYCLVDGYFVERNYFVNNLQCGGLNFYQCLFNPQLDVYAYVKHYRDLSTPVLTWPADLHRYHQDGFPVLLAFRSGEQILSLPESTLWPYDRQFHKLKKILWNDERIPFVPTSDLHFASRNIEENGNGTARIIVPDGDTAGFRKWNEWMKKYSNGMARYFSEITAGDKQCHLSFNGRFGQGLTKFFERMQIPVTFEGDSAFILGNYRFPSDSIGICACFPNPFNPQTYVILNVRGKHVQRRYYENAVDYVIYRDADSGARSKVLARGFFSKSTGKPWVFADSLASVSPEMKSYCIGICSVPQTRRITRHALKHSPPRSSVDSTGTVFSLGGPGSRFPSLTTDAEGRAWVAWEERGDILLMSLNRGGKQVTVEVESDNSDSYQPLLAVMKNQIWVFYLKNSDGFYRLYGRSFDGIRLSDEVLLSDREPFDVFSAAVTDNKSDLIVLCWSVWKANNRFLFTRSIRNNSVEPIVPVKTLGSKGMGNYTDAWYPSLSIDGKGKGWGAWNQHYPSILGICSGNFSDEALSVTRLEEDMDKNENGGYPSALTDRSGKKWVFYESFGWEVLDEQSQKIKSSFFDPVSGTWSLPLTLTVDTVLMMNQSPVASLSADGRIVVVWSGRELRSERSWQLFCSVFDGSVWSLPRQVTRGLSPARAPKICTGKGEELWIAWHSGAGEGMRIKVLRTTIDRLLSSEVNTK